MVAIHFPGPTQRSSFRGSVAFGEQVFCFDLSEGSSSGTSGKPYFPYSIKYRAPLALKCIENSSPMAAKQYLPTEKKVGFEGENNILLYTYLFRIYKRIFFSSRRSKQHLGLMKLGPSVNGGGLLPSPEVRKLKFG